MIYDKLKKYSEDEYTSYKKQTLEKNPTFATTQHDVVELIDYYWVDRFRDSDVNSDGWRRAFYNVVVNPTLVSSKMVDLDTKDIRVIAEQGSSYYPSWIFGRDLKVWLKTKKFGQFLNELVFKTPKYGSTIVQKVGDAVFIAPWQNLCMDTDVSDLHDSSHITQKYEYTPDRMRVVGKNWDSVEDAIAKSESVKENGRVCVYARFGSLPGEYDNYWIYSKEGVVLYSTHFDDVDELYRKLDWDKIPGRMLGRGQVEKLFQAQIQRNRVQNYKTEGLHWSSKHVFQTRDHTIGKNLMTNVQNGDVLKVNSELTPVAVEERNLAAYNQEEGNWDKLVKELTFSFGELSGERPPAGTPLGTSVLQTQQAATFFDMKREDIGLFVKDIITDWVIPSFKKDSQREHTLMLSEFDSEELAKLRGLFQTAEANGQILSFITKNRRLPDAQTQKVLERVAREIVNSKKDMKIPSRFYDNLAYKIDVVITNEQIDTAARLTTLQSILALLASNPGILQNPTTKRIFFNAVELSGFSPIDLDVPEDTETPLQPGGSIASPLVLPPTNVTQVQRV